MNWKKTNEQKKRTGCQCSIHNGPDMQCPLGKYYHAVITEIYAVLLSAGFLRFSQPTKDAIYQDYSTHLEQYHRHVRQARNRTQTLLQTNQGH